MIRKNVNLFDEHIKYSKSLVYEVLKLKGIKSVMMYECFGGRGTYYRIKPDENVVMNPKRPYCPKHVIFRIK